MESLLSASLSQEQEFSRELQRRVRDLEVMITDRIDWYLKVPYLLKLEHCNIKLIIQNDISFQYHNKRVTL